MALIFCVQAGRLSLLSARGPPHASGFERSSNRSRSLVQLGLICCFKGVISLRTGALVLREAGCAAHIRVGPRPCRWQFAFGAGDAAPPAATAAATTNAAIVLFGTSSRLLGVSRDRCQHPPPLLPPALAAAAFSAEAVDRGCPYF